MQSMIKVISFMDEDAHFNVIEVRNRPDVWEALHSQHCGDWWANRDEDEIPDDLDYLSLTEEAWLNVIGEFCQRGTMEVVDIKVTLPDADMLEFDRKLKT